MADLRSFDLVLPPGERLDIFLVRALHERGEALSRSMIQKQIQSGKVTGIQPQELKPSFRSKTPRKITFTLPPPPDNILIPIHKSIPVFYEDEHLAIVHKPAGMTVHPGAGTQQDTLVNALIGQFDKLAPHAERPGIVHRLDRETEGLLLVAKTSQARQRLSAEFAARRVQKKYVALVWGSVVLPEKIDGFIWRDPKDRKKMRFASKISDRVLRARTAELVITSQQRLRCATELELELITGRTHQIRATLKSFNAPIVGDALYGDDEAKYRLYKIGRERREQLSSSGMQLVAFFISFRHPFQRRTLEFSLALPPRFMKTRQLLS